MGGAVTNTVSGVDGSATRTLGARTALMSRLTVTLDGRYPGRAIVMESPDLELFVRVFIAGGRFYQLMASGKVGTVNRSDVEAFFDSFGLSE